MSGFLKKLAVFLGILSTIGSIVIAKYFGVVEKGYSYTYYERDWAMTIMYFCIPFISSMILVLIIYGIGQILENQELIINKFSDFDDLKSSYHNILNNGSISIDPSKEWKCSKCGKVNPNYVGTCSCGRSKNEN